MVQKNNLNNKIIVICGPTASSKTALSVAFAKKIDGEIISADSMNVYKGLDIGTAKPTKDEMEGVIHHLIDVVSPFDTFSVGDYKELARPIVNDILSRGKTPIVCGGTGFYVNSILYDFSYGNTPANIESREKYKSLAEEHGNAYVFNILKEKDPKTAEKLHENDLKRVIRALEICESGRVKSEIVDEMIPVYDYSAYYIDFPREVLYDRINRRVDIMVENGLINEIKDLLNQGVNETHQCMQGIGYKEILPYVNGETDLNTAIEQIKLNTRHYAKRQLTFFKRLNGLKALTPDCVENLADQIIADLSEK